MNLNPDILESAYRKLKSYYYYDNKLNYIKQQISEFENNVNFEENMNLLLKALNDEKLN